MLIANTLSTKKQKSVPDMNSFRILFNFLKDHFMSKIKSIATLFPVVINPKIEEYASQYRLCIKKTAASILELACVVGEAKKDLSYEEFTKFRLSIGAPPSKDSYIKKLLKIANSSSRLSSVSDSLPPNYTTLYELAKMPSDSFQKVRNDGVLSPDMTAKTLSPYLDKTESSSASANEAVLVFKNVAPTQRIDALKNLQELCNKFKIELKTKMILPTRIQNSIPFDIDDAVDKRELTTI